MSDDLGATVAVKNIPPGARAVAFLEAGGDMIISKTLSSATAMHAAILQRYQSDASFSRIVDQAVMSILRAKHAAGLTSC